MNKKIDYRDLMLEASAEVQEIIREVLSELAEPMAELHSNILWKKLPDHIKEQIENEDESSLDGRSEFLR